MRGLSADAIRLRAAAMAITAMVWTLAGCGDVVAPSGGGAMSEVVLADPLSGEHYGLGVANGGLTLTGMGSGGTAAAEVELTDIVTGEGYVLGVAAGALTLAPGGSGAGIKGIGLEDEATEKTYELGIAGGALTLAEGGAVTQ